MHCQVNSPPGTMNTRRPRYHRHRFPPEIISHAVALLRGSKTDPHPLPTDPLTTDAYDAGLPSWHLIEDVTCEDGSVSCPARLRARRLSPMINLYRKKAFSTRAC